MEQEQEVYEGLVKWFSGQKGYGFITYGDNQDIFCHYSAIAGKGYRSLHEGQRVRFEIQPSDKGPNAVNVETV